MTDTEYIVKFNEQIEKLDDFHMVRSIKSITDDFYSDIMLDSLSLMEFIMLCEQAFDKNIYNEHNICKIRTPKDIINILENDKQ